MSSGEKSNSVTPTAYGRFFIARNEVSVMANGKYVEWLEPDNLLLLQAWARDGLTNEQIAANIGISQVTLYDWLRRFPDISNALKRGKAVVDIEVENALYKSAVGFEYEEEVALKRRDANGNEWAEVRKIKKYQPPIITAQIYWLKNRKPKQWRDKPIDEEVSQIKENIQALAEILKSPAPERAIPDAEGAAE